MANDVDEDTYLDEPRQRHVPVRDRVLEVLEFMKSKGFKSYRSFQQAFFDSEDETVRRRAGVFFQRGGFRETLDLMTKHCRFGGGKRVTSQATEVLREEIGQEIMALCLRLLDQEMEALGKVPGLRLKEEDVSSKDVESFSFTAHMRIYEEHAPCLTNVIRKLCNVRSDSAVCPPEDLLPELTNEPEDGAAQGEGDTQEVDEITDEVEEVHEWGLPFVPLAFEVPLPEASKRKQRRRKKNTYALASSVISQMLYARSSRINRFQTVLGFWMQGGAVARRVQTVLGQLGIVCSYGKSIDAMQAFGMSQRQEMRSLAAAGRPFMMCWDNLVRTEMKEEETLLNRRQLLSMTSGYIQFLHIPPPPATSADPRSPDHWMQRAYENIMDCLAGDDAVSLPKRLLQVHEPNYANLEPFDLLFVQSIQSHQPLIARAHVGALLKRFVGAAALDVFRTVEGRKLRLPELPNGPEYYTIPSVKSQLYILPIFDVDETTIDGTSRLVDLILAELNLEAAELVGRHVDTVGDQLSNARVRSLQELRVRDFTEHRFGFAGIKPGYFHVCIAFVNAIFRCNWGREDGRDPGSLARFVTVLGRSAVNKSVSDFNACSRFILQVFDAYVLAGLITIANEWAIAENQSAVKSVKDLRVAVERNNWDTLVETVVRRFFPMTKIQHLRGKATAPLAEMYAQRRAAIMAKRKQERSREEIQFSSAAGRRRFMTENAREERDIVYENALLMCQQLLMYKDFYSAMRAGHAGRMEKDLEVAMVMFAGCGKSNYAKEMME